MNISAQATFLLVITGSGFILETLIQILSNPSYMFGKFGKEEQRISQEVSTYASHALNLAAIIFAGISLILSNAFLRSSQLKEPLLFFAIGVFLFLISYKLQIIGGLRRIFWSMQQRLMNYGVLALSFGLYLAFQSLLPEVSMIILVFLSLVGVIHVAEYIFDLTDTVKGK